MSIKKPHQELVTFLKENENKKVSTILDEVMKLVESKKTNKTYLKDENGNIIAIFCYYHKKWEPLKDVEYGSKANSKTKLNTMCKIGTSKWTKAQKVAKEENLKLLTQVSKLEVDPKDIFKLQDEIEEKRTTIDLEDSPIGFETEEEVLEYINNN